MLLEAPAVLAEPLGQLRTPVPTPRGAGEMCTAGERARGERRPGVRVGRRGGPWLRLGRPDAWTGRQEGAGELKGAGGKFIPQQAVWGLALHPLTVWPGEPPSAKSYPHCARRQGALHISTQTSSVIGDITSSASQRGKLRQRGTCLVSSREGMTVLGTGPGTRPRGSGACVPTPLLSWVLGTGIAEI